MAVRSRGATPTGRDSASGSRVVDHTEAIHKRACKKLRETGELSRNRK